MIENEKLKKMSLKLCSDKHNYMASFRRNLDMYIKDKDITLKKLSDKSDVPFETLKTLVYKTSSDCKLSTAVKLARALDISVDELIGSETICKESRKSLAIARNLPENDISLIRWQIRHLYSIGRHDEKGKRYVSIMSTECNNGNMRMTFHCVHADMSKIPPEYRWKIFFGIKIPCGHFLPKYRQSDTILIANDREPMFNEDSVIMLDGFMVIAKRKVEDGIAKYYSIRDGKFRVLESEVDEVIGYIVGFLNSDLTFRSR